MNASNRTHHITNGTLQYLMWYWLQLRRKQHLDCLDLQLQVVQTEIEGVYEQGTHHLDAYELKMSPCKDKVLSDNYRKSWSLCCLSINLIKFRHTAL